MRVLEDWLLTPFRLAVHESTATAVIADVHLGYREARQQTGDAVPLLDVPTQLAPLRRARRRFSFDKLVVAGDLFERGADSAWLGIFLRELGALGIAFAGLAPGNHDRGWETLGQFVPLYPEGMSLGSWHVVHDDALATKSNVGTVASDARESRKLILGHWHPAVWFEGRRLPCFLVGPDRIVLPAFSGDAAGGAVVSDPRWRDLRRFAIHAGRVIDCGLAPKNENPRRRLRGLRHATGSAGSASRYQ